MQRVCIIPWNTALFSHAYCILINNIIFTLLIARCAGDITDLFDAFDGFNDSAYHAYIGMVQEGEYMAEDEADGEDEGENEEEAGGLNLAEDIATIVAADHNDVSSDRSSDSGSDAGDSADPQMEDDNTSPGYSTMYAQLYTDAFARTGNKCAVVTIVTGTV